MSYDRVLYGMVSCRAEAQLFGRTNDGVFFHALVARGRGRGEERGQREGRDERGEEGEGKRRGGEAVEFAPLSNFMSPANLMSLLTSL